MKQDRQPCNELSALITSQKSTSTHQAKGQGS